MDIMLGPGMRNHTRRLLGFPGVKKTKEADPSGADNLQTVPAIAAFSSNEGLMSRESLGVLVHCC